MGSAISSGKLNFNPKVMPSVSRSGDVPARWLRSRNHVSIRSSRRIRTPSGDLDHPNGTLPEKVSFAILVVRAEYRTDERMRRDSGRGLGHGISRCGWSELYVCTQPYTYLYFLVVQNGGICKHHATFRSRSRIRRPPGLRMIIGRHTLAQLSRQCASVCVRL